MKSASHHLLHSRLPFVLGIRIIEANIFGVDRSIFGRCLTLFIPSELFIDFRQELVHLCNLRRIETPH